MGIEKADYIQQLDKDNPLGSDPIAKGDDHIRLIKAALTNTFPMLDGEVEATPEDLNALVGISSSLPAAPVDEGSMLYSKDGKWTETGGVRINDDDGSVDIGGDINIYGAVTASEITSAGDVNIGGELVIDGQPVKDFTAYTGGDGIDISADREISLSGTYSGTMTATDFVATSDARKKDQVSTAPADVIAAIDGREWVWKDSGEKGSGVIAQELEAAGLGHLVHTNDDGMKSVAYNGLFAYVIEELKALRAAYERDCN